MLTSTISSDSSQEASLCQNFESDLNDTPQIEEGTAGTRRVNWHMVIWADKAPHKVTIKEFLEDNTKEYHWFEDTAPTTKRLHYHIAIKFKGTDGISWNSLCRMLTGWQQGSWHAKWHRNWKALTDYVHGRSGDPLHLKKKVQCNGGPCEVTAKISTTDEDANMTAKAFGMHKRLTYRYGVEEAKSIRDVCMKIKTEQWYGGVAALQQLMVYYQSLGAGSTPRTAVHFIFFYGGTRCGKTYGARQIASFFENRTEAQLSCAGAVTYLPENADCVMFHDLQWQQPSFDKQKMLQIFDKGSPDTKIHILGKAVTWNPACVIVDTIYPPWEWDNVFPQWDSTGQKFSEQFIGRFGTYVKATKREAPGIPLGKARINVPSDWIHDYDETDTNGTFLRPFNIDNWMKEHFPEEYNKKYAIKPTEIKQLPELHTYLGQTLAAGSSNDPITFEDDSEDDSECIYPEHGDQRMRL